MPISTEGSGTPTTRPRTDYPVQGLGAVGKVGCYCNLEIQLRTLHLNELRSLQISLIYEALTRVLKTAICRQ